MRFKVITQNDDGSRSVASFDNYVEASWYFEHKCSSVLWYYDASSVRMVDTMQSTEDNEHILHNCTINGQY